MVQFGQMSTQTRTRVQNKDPTSIDITSSEVTNTEPRTNDLSEFIDIRVPAGYKYVFPGGRPIQMYLMVHEQFTTDGTAGNDETFSLSEDLVNSPTLADADTSQSSGGSEVDSSGAADLVLYDAGTQKAMVSVDYANDQFTYADGGTNSTLDVYYTWGNSSEIHGRGLSRDFEEYKQVFGSTAARFHNANVFDRNEMPTFIESFELDSKEHLKFLINTSVDLTNWADISSDGPNSTSSFSYFQIPVYKLEKGAGPQRQPGRTGSFRG